MTSRVTTTSGNNVRDVAMARVRLRRQKHVLVADSNALRRDRRDLVASRMGPLVVSLASRVPVVGIRLSNAYRSASGLTNVYNSVRLEARCEVHLACRARRRRVLVRVIPVDLNPGRRRTPSPGSPRMRSGVLRSDTRVASPSRRGAIRMREGPTCEEHCAGPIDRRPTDHLGTPSDRSDGDPDAISRDQIHMAKQLRMFGTLLPSMPNYSRAPLDQDATDVRWSGLRLKWTHTHTRKRLA